MPEQAHPLLGRPRPAFGRHQTYLLRSGVCPMLQRPLKKGLGLNNLAALYFSPTSSL